MVAAFIVGCAIFLAAEADLLDGPLRTLLPPLAVLLPGALIVTGMSELAAGAMVAGTSRLVFGTRPAAAVHVRACWRRCA